MTRYKIIANPAAGLGAGAQAFLDIEALMRVHQLNFDLVRTERPWHGADLARQAVRDGYDVVVAAGGDGTANEALNGLMRAKRAGEGEAALGVLTVGRGNDFAFSMGVPEGVDAGCHALAQDYRRTIDVGYMIGGDYPEGRYFGNGVGIGFDAVVGFVAAEQKRLTGLPSYLVAALKTIFLYYQAPRMQIAYNGQTLEISPLMVSIMNGIRLGGGFMMAPEGKPDDGMFDLTIVEQVSRPRIFGLIVHFMRGTQASHPAVHPVKTQHVVATALEGALPAHADGETLCKEGERLELELLPEQIELICQSAEEGA